MQYTHICKVVDVGTQFEIIIGSVTRAWRRRWTFVHSLYSIEEYWEELSRTHAGPDSRFVAATKAYRQLDDEWYDYSLRKAVELAGSDGSPARAILFSGLVEMEA